jgi:hypothetical protein
MYKKYIIFSLLIILSFLLGFYFSNYIDRCNTQTKINSDPNDTYAAGWEAAKKRLQETGNYFIDITFPIKEIWGEIKNITGNKLFVSIKPLDPLADRSLDERIVIIANNTILLQKIKKSELVYNKEIADFKFEEASSGPILPEPYPNMFTESEASIVDFKIGQKIKVEAENDVRNIKEFIASSIVIQYSDN